MLIAFHKPYGVISQFTGNGSPNRTLAEFGFPKNVYPIGRLDADSEGLLLLSDEPKWNERLLHPRHAHEREYWAQVERIPTPEALKKLARGVSIAVGGRGGAAAPPPPGSKGYHTMPCRAWILEPQPEVIPAPVAASRQSAADCLSKKWRRSTETPLRQNSRRASRRFDFARAFRIAG